MSAIVGLDAEIIYIEKSSVDAGTVGAVTAVTINAGGTGYSVGDTVSIGTNPTGEVDAILEVTSESTGVVDGVKINVYGEGYATGTAVATTTETGTGSGLTVDITSINTLVLPTWNSSTESWDLSVNNGEYTWNVFPERNEFSISISVDIADHKVFVSSPTGAWTEKARLYMDWSGSMSGYLDNTDDTIFNAMKAGETLWTTFVDSKSNDITQGAANQPNNFWLGKIVLGTIDRTTPNEDYATLDADFEGNGELYRSAMPWE